jgi:hypothetical protein
LKKKEFAVAIEQSGTNLASWIQETVDRTTTSIEEIHQSIAQIPLDVMRQTGVFDKTADDVGDLQKRSISAVYGAVRDINRVICGVASDLVDPALSDSESR